MTDRDGGPDWAVDRATAGSDATGRPGDPESRPTGRAGDAGAGRAFGPGTVPVVDWVPDPEWATVVRHAPVPSVDLIVRHGDGVVLGRRTTPPAAGEWFVPGGRVRKGERLRAAVDRVAREELGVDVAVERRLGTYEHLYPDADVTDAGGKHYLTTAYVVRAGGDPTPDDQHSTLRTVERPGELDLHPYVRTYLRDAGSLGAPGD